MWNILLGPNKNTFTFLCLVFQRECGQDTGNSRVYIQPDHRLAKWGGGFIMLHHFPVFLHLCLIRWLLLGAATDARAPCTLSSHTWLGGLGLHLLLLKIIEVSSEGYSSTPGSLLDLCPIVSSTQGDTHGQSGSHTCVPTHSCACALSVSLRI